jgi:hypothetical protein
VRRVFDPKRYLIRADFNELKQKYAPFLANLTYSIGPIALIDPMYFFVRRLLMAIIVVAFKDLLAFQLWLT